MRTEMVLVPKECVSAAEIVNKDEELDYDCEIVLEHDHDEELMAADNSDKNKKCIRTEKELQNQSETDEAIMQFIQKIRDKVNDSETFTVDELRKSSDSEPEIDSYSINSVSDSETERSQSIKYRTGLLKVGGRINDSSNSIDILIDTGARVNCIDSNLVKALGNIVIQNNSAKLVAANKSRLKVLGSVIVNIKFEGIVTQHEDEVTSEHKPYTSSRIINLRRKLKSEWTAQQSNIELLVVENLSTPLLLGFPTIEELGTVIDTRNKTISFGNSHQEITLAYNAGEEQEHLLHVVNQITLEPNSMYQIMSVQFQNYEEKTDTNCYLFTGNEIAPGIRIEPGIIDRTTEISRILVSNISNVPITIQKGTRIGSAKKVEWKEDSINSINQEEKQNQNQNQNQNKELEFRQDRNKALKGKGIGKSDRKKIKNLLNKYKEYFARKIHIHHANKVIAPYKIRLQDNVKPVIEAMGRLSPERQAEIDKSIQDLANRGLIEEGNGAWRSRVLLVKKPDGTWRTTIDYRKLNALTIPDGYPMPRIDDMLDRLHGSKYFSKLDMTDGFFGKYFLMKNRKNTQVSPRHRNFGNGEYCQWVQ